MNEGSKEYIKEVDLVDYFKVLLKRKWVVLGGVVVCVLLAGLYKWMQPPAPKVYNARASLLVIPPALKSELIPQFSSIVYQSLAEAQDLKAAIMDTLSTSGNEGLQVADLDDAIKTEVIYRNSTGQGSAEGSGPILLDFLVTSPDTNRLHPLHVVNTWADLFVRKNRGLTFNEAAGSYDYINEQYTTAKNNLEKTENHVVDFNREYNLGILKAELEVKNSKLAEYQTSYINLGLQLESSENSLDRVEKTIASQETPDGMWIGSLSLAQTPPPQNLNLTSDQRRLRMAIVKSRDRLFVLQQKMLQNQLDYDLALQGSLLDRKRDKLIEYLTGLSSLKVGIGTVAQTLQDNSGNALNTIEIPTGVSMTDAELREFLSLQLGYNLLDTRLHNILQEIKVLKNEVDSLSLNQAKKSREMDLLTKQLNLESENYQVFLAQYEPLKKQSSELKVSIGQMKSDRAFYDKEMSLLLKDTNALKSQIAALEMKQTRLSRELTIYKATYDKFANLLEDARITKAAQPEDIKIVARAVTVNVVGSEAKGWSLGIAAIFGAGVSVLLAFFIEYLAQAQVRLNDDK